jgi:mRNA deadenylase 3'-5' endonuclease subunit Ccr4
MNQLKIMSFNILADAPIWKTKYDHIKKEDFIYWDYRKNLIIDIISKNSPDICLLCEVEYNKIPFFANYCILNNYNYIYTSHDPNKLVSSIVKYKDYNNSKNPGNLIIFKFDKVRIINNTAPDYVNYFIRKSKKYNWDKETLDNFILPTVSNIVHFEVNNSGTRFFFIGLHHPYSKENIQKELIDFLLKKINKLNNNYDYPVIICGDFNIKPSDLVYNIMVSNNYNSTYKLFNGVENKYTISNDHFKNTLDYIFINNKCKVIDVVQIDENFMKNNILPNKIFPSDHMFLVSSISF